VSTPPPDFNWDLWLGPAPDTAYCTRRADFNFRYFLDYSGGHITDWGAHHVDIAHWALGVGDTGIVDIEAAGELPLGRETTLDNITGRRRDSSNSFDAASTFRIVWRYPNGSTIILQSEADNGIEFIGEDSRFFVSREKLAGPALRLLGDDAKRAWLEEESVRIYGGTPSTHMKNFMDCVRDRKLPISDVFSHHRAITAVHAGNIALLLGRKLRWDTEREDFAGDEEASALRSRPQQRAQYALKG
jgi:predicted dehydrogenase